MLVGSIICHRLLIITKKVCLCENDYCHELLNQIGNNWYIFMYEGKLFDLPKYIDVKDIYFITNHNLMIDERYVNYHP